MEQCSTWVGTMNYCSSPASKTTEETKLCYECSVEADALTLGRKDIDTLSEALLDELQERSKGLKGDVEDSATLVEGLKRAADLYSRKLFNAERELQSIKEAVAEKKTTTRHPIQANMSLKSLQKKIEEFNTYWRGMVRLHESQLEKAGRNHNVWVLTKVQEKLEQAHNKWERQIEDAFKTAEKMLD
jgi:hypothetical protein